jgi:hypothetical protein
MKLRTLLSIQNGSRLSLEAFIIEYAILEGGCRLEDCLSLLALLYTMGCVFLLHIQGPPVTVRCYLATFLFCFREVTSTNSVFVCLPYVDCYMLILTRWECIIRTRQKYSVDFDSIVNYLVCSTVEGWTVTSCRGWLSALLAQAILSTPTNHPKEDGISFHKVGRMVQTEY